MKTEKCLQKEREARAPAAVLARQTNNITDNECLNSVNKRFLSKGVVKPCPSERGYKALN